MIAENGTRRPSYEWHALQAAKIGPATRTDLGSVARENHGAYREDALELPRIPHDSHEPARAYLGEPGGEQAIAIGSDERDEPAVGRDGGIRLVRLEIRQMRE